MKRVTGREVENSVRLERRAECRTTTIFQALSHQPQTAAVDHCQVLQFKSLPILQSAWTRSSPLGRWGRPDSWLATARPSRQ